MNNIVIINTGLCIGCEVCVDLCPARILYLDDDGICCVSDESRCDRLRGCERQCPTRAIKIN